jgi:hypothetical protein
VPFRLGTSLWLLLALLGPRLRVAWLWAPFVVLAASSSTTRFSYDVTGRDAVGNGGRGGKTN